MARPKRGPAVLIEATIRENGKLADLPSDTARLGYVYICLGAAKLLKPIPGMFSSRSHFREVAGRFAPHLARYIALGLMEEAPNLCDRCSAKWSATPPAKGALVTHDWHEHQYDPFHAERQAAYAERQKERRTDGQSDARTDGQSDGHGDADPDASTDAGTDGPTDGNLTSASRASVRGPARSGPRDRGPNSRTLNSELSRRESQVPHSENARNGRGNRAAHDEPRLTREQLDAWSELDDAAWEPFKRAWLARGFVLPPPEAQRAVLWEVADARPNDIAAWVGECPKGDSAYAVVDNVLRHWHELAAVVRAQDERDAADRKAALAADRRGAAESLDELEAFLR